MKNESGFTLVESLIAISIGAVVATSFIKLMIQNVEQTNSNIFAADVVDIISAVDSRLSIDGFNETYWNKKVWNTTSDVQNDLLRKQLIAKDATCGTGTWIPKNTSENKTKLVNCSLWEDKIPLNMNVSAKLKNDGHGFITGFDLLMSFKTNEQFEKDFPMFRNAIKQAKSKDSQEKVGRHTYNTVKKDNPDIEISLMQCIKEKNNCAFRATFDRSGYTNYLKVDGSNSMIDSNVSFMKSSTNSPLQCDIWQKQADGSWSLFYNKNCGIGIYKEGTIPIVANVVADNVTAENVLLNQECPRYSWDSTTNSVIKDTTNKIPCGMSKDGSTIVQVTDKIHTKDAIIEDAKIQILRTKDIISEYITTDFIKAKSGLTQLVNNAKVNGNFTIDGSVKANGHSEFNTSTFFDAVNMRKNLVVDQDASANRLFTNYLQSNGNLHISGNSQLNGTLTTNGYSTFKDNVKVNKGLSVDWDINSNRVYSNYLHSHGDIHANGTINSNGTVQGNHLYSRGGINAAGTVSGNHIYSRADMNAEGQVSANRLYSRGRTYVQEYIELRGHANENWGCSPNGLIGREGNGSLLTCVNGKWTKLGAKVTWDNMPAGSRCGNYVMSGNTTKVEDLCVGHNPRYSCPPGFVRRDFGYFEAGGGSRQYNWCTKL